MSWFLENLILILFLLLLVSNRSFLQASCPPGWLKWRQSCYIRLPNRMNWFEASEACNRPGGSMIVPNSREENLFIWESLVKGTGGLWIGCTDAAQEGVWLCDGQPAQYTNWHPRYPSRSNKRNCARISTYEGWRWVDKTLCNRQRFAACEMTPSSVPAYHTFTGPDGRVPQRCLLHHDIKNLTAEGLLSCGWACWADPRCRSFNLWQSNKKEKMCQLNDVTRLVADDNDFKATDNCYFFNL
ncbi:perlucin-like protein isoform X1 [Patiria miniata]|uniref:C-type lectin domain-containing protein n=2 Tax=Patiria miniata TaxID=46514 RepID=A0A914B028_PATMI|nr:perlucin-like protein isoform X1 [Patiria miniata]